MWSPSSSHTPRLELLSIDLGNPKDRGACNSTLLHCKKEKIEEEKKKMRNKPLNGECEVLNALLSIVHLG